MEEEKTPIEKAMERDCIILVAVEILTLAIRPLGGFEDTRHNEKFNVKCRGPECAQYSIFTNFCGLGK